MAGSQEDEPLKYTQHIHHEIHPRHTKKMAWCCTPHQACHTVQVKNVVGQGQAQMQNNTGCWQRHVPPLGSTHMLETQMLLVLVQSSGQCQGVAQPPDPLALGCVQRPPSILTPASHLLQHLKHVAGAAAMQRRPPALPLKHTFHQRLHPTPLGEPGVAVLPCAC